jgi:rubrerythrin
MVLTRDEISEIAGQIADDLVVYINQSRTQFREPKTVEAGLKESMSEELTASMWYQLRARNARGYDDVETAKLYEELARDENQHYEELGQRLNTLPAWGRAHAANR